VNVHYSSADFPIAGAEIGVAETGFFLGQ